MAALVCALLVTPLCVATAPRLLQAWRGDRPFVAFDGLFKNRERQARAGVALLVSVYVLCIVSWLFVIADVYDARWFVALTGFALVSFFVSVGFVVTAYAIGRPRFLIPPALRSVA